MLGQIFEAFSAGSLPLPSIETVLKAFNVEDFARPEFQSALMAKVVLEAEKANVDLNKLDFGKLRSFLSQNTLLSKYQQQLEGELIAWVEKIARQAGRAAAEEAIAALHLEEMALGALFILARILLFVCTGGLHS
jgi:hypothetical protein